MLSVFRNLLRPRKRYDGFRFSRPLVMLQSDDWGRVGVRDRDGYEELRARGIRLGERPYDLYSLETAEDVRELASLLRRHRDCSGRAASMVMNFCTANLDFEQMRRGNFERIELLPLYKGLPGKWQRPGLFDAYRDGVREGVFFPALHGITHFCSAAVERALAENAERAHQLRLLWESETPYIYWRMPWIGYEYLDPRKKSSKFLPLRRQRELLTQNCKYFARLFDAQPFSACAPGFRSNADTHRAWAECGVRVAQNGSGNGLRAPHMDEFGVMHLYRSIDFEPCHGELDVIKYVEIAGACFSQGLPFVISTHSINFHSTLKDFRSGSLAGLDGLLTALERRFPELLYVHDADLHRIVNTGMLQQSDGKIKVTMENTDGAPQTVQQEAFQ